MARSIALGLVVAVIATAGILATGLPAFAQGNDVSVITILSVEISPSQPQPGETMTVTASVSNSNTSAIEHMQEVKVNGDVVASGLVRLASGETREVSFSFVAPDVNSMEIMLGDVTKVVRITESKLVADTDAKRESVAASEGKMRVGPSVRLDTRQTEITNHRDAVIDLFWNNSVLNDKSVNIEVSVDVPSGLYLHSQDGGMACAAGRCLGRFEAPPGSVRNMPLIVKADSAGDYFIHMNGRYWPEDDRDNWSPISLSTPIRVLAPSRNPQDPNPTSGVEGYETTKRWWLTPMALVAWALLAVVIIATAGFRAISRSVRAARSNPPTIDIG